MNVAGVGLLTGWGRGVEALPEDARAVAAGRYVVGIPAPERSGGRHRRATRECLLGIAAVQELLRQARLQPADLAGSDTALLYATASAYGASNRAFIESAGGTLHFPYTAPSAVPAEVAIEYGLCGAYLNFIGGATATIDALWYASRLLEHGECNQALVLAVETFEECGDLYRRARWLAPGPLVEAAACALLRPGSQRWVVDDAAPVADRVRRRAGETFACAPLIALAVSGSAPTAVGGAWRGRRATLRKTSAVPRI
jgi:3-oxoacyl-(acyl-carrier-protein) synthase